LADPNGDGSISFTEFFFFITILQLPDPLLKESFELHCKDGCKDLNADEFSKMLYDHRYNTKYGKKLQDKKTIIDSRNVRATEEDFRATNKDITARIFAKKPTLSLHEFFLMRDKMQEQLWHYEFYQYDVEEIDGKLVIPMSEFCKSNMIFLPYSTF